MEKLITILMIMFCLNAFGAVKIGETKRIKTVSANYTITKFDEVIFVDVSGGNKTVTLIDSSTVIGKVVTVIKSDNSSNYVSVTDGTNTWTVVSQNERLKVFSVGTSWLEDEVKGEIPAGQVIAFAGAACPKGFLDADGTTYDPAKHPKLALAIGSTWGANAKPDLRGAFLRGSGASGIGLGTGSAVGSTQADATAVNGLKVNNGDNIDVYLKGSGGQWGVTITGGFSQRTQTLTGDSETRPANAAVKYCIKY